MGLAPGQRPHLLEQLSRALAAARDQDREATLVETKTAAQGCLLARGRGPEPEVDRQSQQPQPRLRHAGRQAFAAGHLGRDHNQV